MDVKRVSYILLGLLLFLAVYFAPMPDPAVDPQGQPFPLTREGKAALALFFLAATWWVTEVIPIGVTSITIAVVQALLLIRPARTAFTDFMDPSVWFIFGSLVFGMVFTQTGLTRRMAYKMLSLVGERTSMILLGSFVMTSALTLIMAHTAVAATVFPLFMAIYGLYSEGGAPSRFGKSLFMGMAFVAGAGSIITLLGAARGAVAIGFFQDITGRSVSFFELTYYMLPIGVLMTFVLWAFFMVYYPPERKTIPGLRERVARLYSGLGPVTVNEILALVIVLGTITVLSLRQFVPVLEPLDKSAIILVATILFFLFNVVSLKDLEGTSWNIILLFGGAMSLGLCLWQTGAAEWLAVTLAQHVPGRPLAAVRDGDRRVRPGHDEPDHERGGDRDHHAGRPRDRALRGRGPRGDPVRVPGGRRDAVPPSGGGSSQRDRLRQQPVHHGGVLPRRHPGEHRAHRRAHRVRVVGLARDGDAGAVTVGGRRPAATPSGDQLRPCAASRV